MRFISVIIFLFMQFYTYSQEIQITDISDTTNIFYSSFDKTFYLTDKCTGKQNWIVYYDKTHTKLAYSVLYQNDTIEILNYYKNGFLKKKKVVYKDFNKIKGISETWWYNNGQLKADVNFSIFPCIVKNYYRSGKQRMEFYYIDEWLTTEGKFIEWYENGKLKSEGIYNDNEKHGIWKYYKQTGELEKTEVYDNGKLIRPE